MLTVKQVAERLQISVSKMYELIREGDIAVHKIGGSFRISESDLCSYLDACRVRFGKRIRRSDAKLKHLRIS